MRRYLALACVLLLGACGDPATEPVEESRVYDPVVVPDATTLSGRKVERVDQGPWSMRRMAAETDTRNEKRKGGGPGAPSGGPVPTSPAPSSAPVPRTSGGDVSAEEPVIKDEEIEDHVETDSDLPFEGKGDDKSDPDDEGMSDRPFEGPSTSGTIGVGGGGGGARRGAGGKVAGRMAGGRVRAPSRGSGTPLKAGTTDDNDGFPAFLEFLASWSDQEGVADRYDPIDVRDRRYVRVVDAKGHIVPAARVYIVDEERDAVLLSGTTYGDGRVPFYPHAHAAELAPTSAAKPSGGYLVEVRKGASRRRMRWNGEDETLTVALDTNIEAEATLKLDVCFVIDTTGSMSDEIERIKTTLLAVTERLRSLSREFDLKYGAVLYRDLGDQYVTMAHPFTGDIEAFSKALQGVRAAGGGDMPESLNQGLAEGVGRLAWRDGAAKVMFVIADAPAHMDYAGDVKYGESLRAALDKGIRIHAVAASGLNAFGSLMFRQIAQFTRGKFVFIEYGRNVAASAAKHGVKGVKKSNNLDDILYEQIERELAEWGREPSPTAGAGAAGASMDGE